MCYVALAWGLSQYLTHTCLLHLTTSLHYMTYFLYLDQMFEWGKVCVELLISNTLHHTIVYMQITCLQSVIYTFRLKLNSQVNGSLEPLRVYSFYFAGEFKKMVLKEIPTDNITRPLGRNEVIGLLFRLTIFGAVTYFTIKWMVDAIDPTRKQKLEAQKQVCCLI